MQMGDRVLYCGGWSKQVDISIVIVRGAEECLDIFGRTEMRSWARREDTDQEGYIFFGLRATLELERVEGPR
jgi:hypothetical protein